MGFKERRKHERLSLEGPVFVKILSSTRDESLRGKTLYCSTKDLSLGGLRVHSEHDIPIGCTLHLWVGLSDSPGTYMMSGRVAWQKDDGASYVVGIEFVNVENDELAAWKEMVSQRLAGG